MTTTDVPTAETYLPAGDAGLTRAVIAACEAAGVAVRADMRRSPYYPPRRVGIWAPKAVIDAERARLAATAEKRTAAKNRRQARDAERFAERIRRQFPRCPEESVREIAEHTTEIGSGRVGRSRVADDAVRAAVVAHIRHRHTNYDDILHELGTGYRDRDERESDREFARGEVREKIDAVLAEWSAPDG